MELFGTDDEEEVRRELARRGVTPHESAGRMFVSAYELKENPAMGDSAPIGVYQLVPATGRPETPDIVVFAVHDNTAAWAENFDYLGENPAGQAVTRHFNAILDCNMSLWTG